MIREILGNIMITSGQVKASDPCYGDEIWCNTTIKNVLNGEYEASIDIMDCDVWGDRVAKLEIHHKDYLNKPTDFEYEHTCGVDSGTFCLADLEYYKEHHTDRDVNEDWYQDYVVDMSDKGHCIDERCVISNSGFGDGGYDVYIHREQVNGYIVGVEVIFIDEDEEDFEEYEYDENEE